MSKVLGVAALTAAPAGVMANRYGLDEIEPGDSSVASSMVFGVGLVAVATAWHRYNKAGASATEAILQALIGLALMWLGASMR